MGVSDELLDQIEANAEWADANIPYGVFVEDPIDITMDPATALALVGEIRRLREALEPFVSCATETHLGLPGNYVVFARHDRHGHIVLTADHFKRAYDALTPSAFSPPPEPASPAPSQQT